ncbi:MAG TPA: hypothetical protein VFS62_04145, partial [Chloroflexota bacterium]|nr:hypothetical protein [Chloroflexota bacterium]
MAVIRLELTSRPWAGGRAFGATGPYEQLRGTAYFAVDPAHELNQRITDLELAPRNAAGKVEFSADLRILRPMDAGRGNRGLLLDVVNRGNPVAMRSFDLSPAGRVPEEDGSGWPLQRGYTVLTCGWQHNVPGGTERFALAAPEARINGKPITGKIRYLWQLDSPTDVIDVTHETSGAAHTGYPVLDVNDPEAVLIERDYPLGPSRTIARDRWRFESNRTSIRYAGGFEPGKTYEVVFTAEGAPVTGIGFAALRDAVSFLRFGPREAGNPCAGSLDWAIAFGTSQTGRLLRHVLYEGFVEDEDGRLAIDGILANVAGPLRTEANVRFGQPS